MATADRTTRTEQIRALLVCNDGDYFVRHRLGVATRLSSIGADVTVIAGGKPIPARSVQGWRYIHSHIERFRFAPVSDFVLMARTARAIWLLKPDAVQLITLKPTIFSGIASVACHLLCGYPKRILVTLPGLGRMMSRPKRPGERHYPIGTAFTLLIVWILARFDCVHFTFETRHDFEFWSSKGIASNENSSIIDGAGVDPELFYPSRISRSNSKTKIIFASRLLRPKGLGVFLMAARQLANRPDVQFIVAGMSDDQDPDSFRPEYLRQLNEICFLGYVGDMPSLLRNCDIVCLPTRYGEGIPRILIEAAATGLASIVSDHPGCCEVVENGVTGQILSAFSDFEMSQELSVAVVEYLENPERLKEHKQAAYRHFRSRKFNEDACVARFIDLLGIDSAASSK